MTLVLVVWLVAVATVSARAFVARRPRLRSGLRSVLVPPRTSAPRIAILRPCAGAEPELARCLSSWPTWTGAPARAVLAVATAADPALAVAEAAARSLLDRGMDARVIVTGARGPNRKAAQLAEAARAAGDAGVLVVADSDVDLEGLDLHALIAPITADERVGACWAPPVEHGIARTWGDRASHALLGASLHAFPLLSRLDRRGMVGKLVAFRRSSLVAIGGFAPLVDVLGEDMELARRLARHGERVVVVGPLARSLASGRDLGAIVARYTRWLAVIRSQRPLLLASYPLLFAATPLLVIAALASGAPWIAAAAIVVRVIVARLAQAACRRRGSMGEALLEACASDALLLAALGRALVARDVIWRGERLRVLPGGRLVSVGDREGSVSQPVSRASARVASAEKCEARP